jgi:hypothetical protein
LTSVAEQLENWIPISVQWQQTEPLIDWCYLGERRFTESFFDVTIEDCLRHPFNLLFRQLTTIDVLEECHGIRPGLYPTGFIFHLSRCGSTLVSQMLAKLPQNIMISEAPPLDWMIRANIHHPEITDKEHIAWIQWMISALGQKRNQESQHCFIKFDAWHTFYLDLIGRAFPNVPWIFLYRNPIEVMVSHNKQRGIWTVPGAMEHGLQDLSFMDYLQMSPDEYGARFLAQICKSALQYRHNPNVLFVNYTQLPQFVTSRLLQHFRVSYSDKDIQEMNAASRFDAKSPCFEFTSDVEKKQNEASETIRELSDKLLMPLYEQLEAVRQNSVIASSSGV